MAAATEDYTSKLPDYIIHHILSFLRFSSKAAVQTSVLSKAWLRACRTRPNLWFYYREIFSQEEDTNITDLYRLEKRRFDFIHCIDSTLQRYHKQKIGIDSLKLTLPSVSPAYVNRWIEIAVENGLKSLEIFMSRDSCGYILPPLVFEAKTLVELSLGKLQLKPDVINSIRCHNLRRLSLSEVDLDESMFQRIMSSCPLIESMEVSCCVGLVNIKVTKLQKLKEFHVVLKGSGFVEVDAPSLEGFNYSKERIFYSGGASDGGLKMYASHNLKRLSLCNVGVTDGFFADIAKKFPHLVTVNIKNCRELKSTRISSHSIEKIDLEQNVGLEEVRLDVPSMNAFNYIGNNIPFFSFTEAPFGGCSWVSYIDLSYGELERRLNTSWFSKLKDLLTNLHQYEVSLKLHFFTKVSGDVMEKLMMMNNNAVAVTIFPPPRVKKLSIVFQKDYVLDVVDLVLDAIFWTCWPETVVQNWYESSDSSDSDFLHWCSRKTKSAKVIFEILMLRLQKTSSRFWQKDLKDVKVVKYNNEDEQRVLLTDPLEWDILSKLSAVNGRRNFKYELELEWET